MEGLKIMFVVSCGISAVICMSCDISQDCGDNEGRTLCYEKTCRSDVPCNKDNDCFFYGAADVSQGYPHPKCYDNPLVTVPIGYGICMLREYAGHLERIPGKDVVDLDDKLAAEASREVDGDLRAMRELFKLIKK